MPPRKPCIERKADKPRYRLLDTSDTIRADDEVIDDDGERWVPMVGWEIGMRYSHIFKSVRRKLTDGDQSS